MVSLHGQRNDGAVEVSERILITATIAIPLMIAVAWLVQAIGGTP